MKLPATIRFLRKQSEFVLRRLSASEAIADALSDDLPLGVESVRKWDLVNSEASAMYQRLQQRGNFTITTPVQMEILANCLEAATYATVPQGTRRAIRNLRDELQDISGRKITLPWETT